MLLQIALGDLSIYDPSNTLTLDSLKNLLNAKNFKKQAASNCCLLHSEDAVRKLLISPHGSHNNIAATKKKVGNKEILVKTPKSSSLKEEGTVSNQYIPLIEALTMGGQFSEGFVDFLCSCLRLDENQRLRSEDLLDHEFLMEEHKCSGPVISVKDFLKMRVKENKPTGKNILDTESEEHLEKFSEALGVVLLNKDVQEKFEEMVKKETSNDKKINEIANELVVSPKHLWGKIKICINNLKNQP